MYVSPNVKFYQQGETSHSDNLETCSSSLAWRRWIRHKGSVHNSRSSYDVHLLILGVGNWAVKGFVKFHFALLYALDLINKVCLSAPEIYRPQQYNNTMFLPFQSLHDCINMSILLYLLPKARQGKPLNASLLNDVGLINLASLFPNPDLTLSSACLPHVSAT